MITEPIFVDDYIVFKVGDTCKGLIKEDTFLFEYGNIVYKIPIECIRELSSNISSIDKYKIKNLMKKRRDAYNSGWGWFTGGSILAIIGSACISKNQNATIGLYSAGGVAYMVITHTVRLDLIDYWLISFLQ